jgi:hypothetical protein
MPVQAESSAFRVRVNNRHPMGIMDCKGTDL